MADSSITKQALASSFKELMQEKQFSQISIGDICRRCGMNRKSFYYHFRDKYDLMNWIFCSEFSKRAKERSYADAWEKFEDLCVYLHDNRGFYRKALSVKGQNSFHEFFREGCMGTFIRILDQSLEPPDNAKFHADFFADAFICAIERWLKEDEIAPDEFARLMHSCFKRVEMSA